MLANVGDMVNKGVELTLGANIVRTKDFSLSANASLAYNKQEITKLSNSQYQAVGLQAGSLHNIRGLSGVYSQVIEEGYAAGEFYGYVCQGIDENGNYITAGGRVLGVCCVRDTLPEAIAASYAAAKEIRFDKMHFRSDIGARALRVTEV